MTSRRCLAAVVLLVMAALAPLAFASPPDPSWIAGFWDDEDYDDVVLLATNGVGTVNARPVPEATSLEIVSVLLPLFDEKSPAAVPSSWQRPRGPPVS